jgi:hypothetical protein
MVYLKVKSSATKETPSKNKRQLWNKRKYLQNIAKIVNVQNIEGIFTNQ